MNGKPAWRDVFPAWVALPVLLGLAANLWALVGFGLLPDEAYYWVWSQRLQAGYFDHPPLVAWMIRACTALFGQAAWAVRLPAVLTWLVAAALVWRWGQRRYGAGGGALAVLVWSSLPVAAVGFHIVTPDSPLILFTWVAFYLVERALTEERPAFWVGAGIAAGLALLGKYTAVLTAPGILLALLGTRRGRAVLGTPWPWVGGLLSVALFLPVVYWNARHGFVSFRFQLGHGVHASLSSPLANELTYWAGQLAVAMPWTLVAMMVAASPPMLRRTGLAAPLRQVLAVGFWLPLLVFGAAGLTAKSLPNWPVAAYVPGSMLLTALLHEWLGAAARSARRLRFARGGLVAAYLAALAFVLLVRYPQWLATAGVPLPRERTQLSQAYGWPAAVPALRSLLAEAQARRPAGPRCVVLARRQQDAAMVAWLLQDVARVDVAPQARMSQFQLWREGRPVPREAACLYLETFDAPSRVPEQVRLGPLGLWRRVRVVVVSTPDLVRRSFAFYVPPSAP